MIFSERKYRDHMLTFAQRDLLKAVIAALGPFEELTDLLSGEKVVTISSVAPMLHHIHQLCTSPHPEVGEDERMPNILAKIYDYISSR